jgi:hypothetical protein
LVSGDELECGQQDEREQEHNVAEADDEIPDEQEEAEERELELMGQVFLLEVEELECFWGQLVVSCSSP